MYKIDSLGTLYYNYVPYSLLLVLVSSLSVSDQRSGYLYIDRREVNKTRHIFEFRAHTHDPDEIPSEVRASASAI
jgi:hypothetical protein